jgi:hypothetical protein
MFFLFSCDATTFPLHNGDREQGFYCCRLKQVELKQDLNKFPSFQGHARLGSRLRRTPQSSLYPHLSSSDPKRPARTPSTWVGLPKPSARPTTRPAGHYLAHPQPGAGFLNPLLFRSAMDRSPGVAERQCNTHYPSKKIAKVRPGKLCRPDNEIGIFLYMPCITHLIMSCFISVLVLCCKPEAFLFNRDLYNIVSFDRNAVALSAQSSVILLMC